MAGFTIVIIPTVALYLSSQKLILSKFTVGGLKG
jgi:ABC-type maltose transport system permease subunit